MDSLMKFFTLAALLLALIYGRISRRKVNDSRKAQHFWMDTAIRFEADNHRLRHYLHQMEKGIPSEKLHREETEHW